MGLVSVTTVASFESVGAILVVGLLVVPPATAYLLTDRLHIMILLSAGIGVISTVLGYYAAYLLDASIAGCMVTVAGILFVLVFLFFPEARHRRSSQAARSSVCCCRREITEALDRVNRSFGSILN